MRKKLTAAGKPNGKSPIRMQVLICLPTFGSPYIWATGDSISLEEKQKLVQGDVEWIPPNDLRIHPMFPKNCTRWKAAAAILPYSQVLINEEGKFSRCPNMAVLNLVEKCPVFGEVGLLISAKRLKKLRINLDGLTLVKNPDNEDGIWEPEDEAEQEKWKKMHAEKGHDLMESTGQCYKSKL